MAQRNSDLEMYAVLDPRITLLNSLRDAQWPVPTSRLDRDNARETARRKAQWPTWQMDRSRPDRSAPIDCAEDSGSQREGLPVVLRGAGFLVLIVVAVAMLVVGIEMGLL